MGLLPPNQAVFFGYKPLTLSEYGQVLDQFETDCDNDAYRWLPIAPAVLV